MADSIEAGVLEEIDKFVSIKSLRLEQRLYHDLYITGEDAGELLDNIHHRFKTRFDDLDFQKFFSDEQDLLTCLIEKWFPSLIREPPLTIKHLVDVVRAGRWFDPPD